MIKTGGVTSLYRGVTAPLMGVAPIFALSFAGNAAGQNIVRNVTGHQKLNYGELFAGGCIAGIYSTVIMAPGERIKVFNPQAPVAQKVADEVVFRRFQGEGVEFFKIGPH